MWPKTFFLLALLYSLTYVLKEVKVMVKKKKFHHSNSKTNFWDSFEWIVFPPLVWNVGEALWVSFVLNTFLWPSQVVLVVKNSPANAGDITDGFNSWDDPLEEEMATLSSILAWRITWIEEPSGLQSIGLQRVRRDWIDLVGMHTLFIAHFQNTFFRTW